MARKHIPTPPEAKGMDVLAIEHGILKRIITRLLPDILRGLFKRPVIVLRQLSVTVFIVFIVGLDYLFQLMLSPFSHEAAKGKTASP